jgi:ubiquinone biosynthesis protein UbiJ
MRHVPQGEKGGRIFWGTLQALTVMRKLREANFLAHPALSHILNLHLQDNLVSKADMVVMEKKLKTVLDEVKALKSAADRGAAAKKKGKGSGAPASTPT